MVGSEKVLEKRLTSNSGKIGWLNSRNCNACSEPMTSHALGQLAGSQWVLLLRGQVDVVAEILFRQLMHILLSCWFEEHRPNRNHMSNNYSDKMSSDMGSVPDPKIETISSLLLYKYNVTSLLLLLLLLYAFDLR